MVFKLFLTCYGGSSTLERPEVWESLVYPTLCPTQLLASLTNISIVWFVLLAASHWLEPAVSSMVQGVGQAAGVVW